MWQRSNGTDIHYNKMIFEFHSPFSFLLHLTKFSIYPGVVCENSLQQFQVKNTCILMTYECNYFYHQLLINESFSLKIAISLH